MVLAWARSGSGRRADPLHRTPLRESGDARRIVLIGARNVYPLSTSCQPPGSAGWGESVPCSCIGVRRRELGRDRFQVQLPMSVSRSRRTRTSRAANPPSASARTLGRPPWPGRPAKLMMTSPARPRAVRRTGLHVQHAHSGAGGGRSAGPRRGRGQSGRPRDDAAADAAVADQEARHELRGMRRDGKQIPCPGRMARCWRRPRAVQSTSGPPGVAG
jgi:hypothetical protein